MKNLRICLTLLLLSTASLIAQTDTAKAPVYGWAHTLVSGLTATQVAFTDWSQGGDNALAWALSLDGKSTNNQPATNWENTFKFAFGQTRLGTQGTRKTDDKIDLESILGWKVDPKINPYVAATLKTQFAPGYKYAATGERTEVSKFFDPAFLTQSVGVRYQAIPQVKTRLGVALREVLTSQFALLYADDPSTPLTVEKTRIQGGLESVTDVEWKLEENLLFTAKLELFAPMKTLDQIVVRSDNTLAAKVSKYVTVVLNMQLINERMISPRTQVKETLALGLSYTII